MKITRIITGSLLTIIALALIVAFIAFITENVETKNMDEAARKNTGGQFIELTDGITHYEKGGTDTGKTIILVHGFSVPYYIWGGMYDSLIKEGFQVIRYDEFGRGFSDRPDKIYDPAFYRKQLFDLIQALHLKTPVDIMGVSFGGAVITDFAAHYPSLTDKVILIDPVYLLKKLGVSPLIANYMMALQHKKQASGQLDDFKYPQHFPGWVEQYKIQMQYKGFRHALISTLTNYPQDTILANYKSLGNLHKKILLIWGREDKTVPFYFSDSVRQLLQPSFFAVADAAHLPYLEQPAVVNREIFTFLKSN